MDELLRVAGLGINFKIGNKEMVAVDNISFSIKQGETLALVGESGCGKSITCLSIMRLLATPPARISSGKIIFNGKELFKLSESEMRRLRGNELAMIFQEPMTSFNPVLTIGEQLLEAVDAHGRENDAAGQLIKEKILEVGLANPELIIKSYPHELSGGMKQRAIIAMALLNQPKLLLCDEPTTALDVTIQAQILDLLKRLQAEHKMAMLFITHNLGIVAGLAHNAAVMYAGRIVELAPTGDLYKLPLHPYTIGLFKSIPRISEKRERLQAIEGMVPGLTDRPSGCAFAPRCKRAKALCLDVTPELEEKQPGHFAACHFVWEKD